MSNFDEPTTPKVFVLSLHRTATKSTHCLLSWLGYQSLHWPKYIDGHDFERNFEGYLHLLGEITDVFGEWKEYLEEKKSEEEIA